MANVTLFPDVVAVFSAVDLVSAFYLLQPPRCWPRWFTDERWVGGRFAGGVLGVLTRACSGVLLMEFSGATGFMQHWHWRLALGRLPRSLERSVPGLDAKFFGRAAVPQLVGLATDIQGRFRTLFTGLAGVHDCFTVFSLACPLPLG